VSVATSIPTVAPVLTAAAACTIGVLARPGTVRRPGTISPLHQPVHSLRRRARRWSVGVVAVLAALVAVLGGPFLVGIGGVTLFAVRHLSRLRVERRRRSDIERELPDAMDLLVLSVRAGLTPFQAVRELAGSSGPAVGDAFGEVGRRTERGQPFADALTALPELLGPGATVLADMIATSDRHGLALGPMLDQLTVETRAARRRLDQAAARKLPVRLSFPLVACTLPSFVLLAIAPAVIAALSSLGGTAW
jgi:tight adherence protein C